MPDFGSILDALNNPSQRHAAMVHWPIVLAMLMIPLTFVAAILPTNKSIRTIAITAAGVLTLSGLFAMYSGEDAEEAIPAILTPDVYDEINVHEEMAERVWQFGAGLVLLLAIGALKSPAMRYGGGWLAVIVSLACAGWTAQTAHHGGTLVYAYGVGTPNPAACYELPGERSDGRDHAAEHAASASGQAAASSDPEAAFFAEHVLPILTQNCISCHNPAKIARSGQLDQTTLDGLLKGGWSGPAIVPGKPEESLLIKRVRGDDPAEDTMPPPPNPKLNEEQIKALEQWIRDGAVWDDGQE